MIRIKTFGWIIVLMLIAFTVCFTLISREKALERRERTNEPMIASF
jgi:hypothetical protein